MTNKSNIPKLAIRAIRYGQTDGRTDLNYSKPSLWKWCLLNYVNSLYKNIILLWIVAKFSILEILTDKKNRVIRCKETQTDIFYDFDVEKLD